MGNTNEPPLTAATPAVEVTCEYVTVPSVVTSTPQRPVLVWLDQYVDFDDILNNAQNEPAYAMSLNNFENDTPTFNFVPRKKRPMTETEWCTAWDNYLALYIQKYPEQLTDLITYSQQIEDLMKSGANWRVYDNQFRVDREHSTRSWAAIIVDVQLSATLNKTPNTYARSYQPFPTARPSRPNTPQQQRTPAGYCYNYHSQLPQCDASRHNVDTNTPVEGAATITQSSVPASHNNPQATTCVPDRQIPTATTTAATSLPTPIQTYALSKWLPGYEHAEHAMSIFTLGVHLDFQGVEMLLTSLNSQSALIQRDVVQAKLEHEPSQDRVAGPFHTPLLTNFKSSPLAIREKQAPGTYRLLHNLSYPYDHHSVNYHIPKSASTVTYETLSDAIIAINNSSPNTYLANNDIAEAFRLIPLYPSQYHLHG